MDSEVLQNIDLFPASNSKVMPTHPDSAGEPH